MTARVSHIWRHPIKGHGVEPIDAVTLAPGKTMPWDRVWAIAHEAARVHPDNAAWAACANFSRGAKSPQLMAIRAKVDETAGTVTLTHPRLTTLTVNPDDPAQAGRLVDWVLPISDPDRACPAFVVRGGGAGLTDSAFPSIAVLNRASLDELAARIGKPLAMERFRGNIWVDGLEPWAEFDWIDRDLRIGGATLRVRQRITRCKATCANPDSGKIDADTLGALQAGWDHQDFGIYAEVTGGGRVAVADPVVVA